MADNRSRDLVQKTPPDLLTVRDAADLLNVSVSLVYLLVDTRKLASHRIGAGRGTIRIFRNDLDEFLATCRRARVGSSPSGNDTTAKSRGIQ